MSHQPTASTSRSSLTRATPRARRLLLERGADSSQITGSGPGGRITAIDVIRLPGDLGNEKADHDGRRPLSAMRRIIARRLVESKQTIPHFYLRQTIDAGPLADHHTRSKARFKCSLNDVIVKAAALAVREFPIFRSRLDADDLVELSRVNIGLAVGLDDGVVVPVLLDADRLGLDKLAAETRRLAETARARRIENTGQAVFTVTNLGMFGTEEFTAIINPPEAAILAVGALRDHVFARDGRPVVGRALTLTLSCDHRIIDGVSAARFIARLEQLLLSPQE
jgi:pyruvate dehydrogenase E2 component (dihydrolipoamide acetyltransferase)